MLFEDLCRAVRGRPRRMRHLLRVCAAMVLAAANLGQAPALAEEAAAPAEPIPVGTTEKPPHIIGIDTAPDEIARLLEDSEAGGKLKPDTEFDLWARLRAGFALPELDSPLVAENERWYAERPEYVARMVERARRYLFYIVEEVEKRGMPSEIALLPMIESAFDPQALSRAGAAGLWQFIPSTARAFGLAQNWWVDGRRDVLAATRAALDYLDKLYAMFGDWHLALAAYNWGEGALSRAIAKNRAQGLPTDYLSLRLPAETANYVPRLLAVKHLIADPQSFGLSLGPLPNRPYFARITLDRHMDVAAAARLAEIPVSELLALNPHLSRPVIHADLATTLLLPADRAEVFTRNLEGQKKPLLSWKTYFARTGERLDRIARRHGIALTRLLEINGLSPRSKRVVHPQPLLVPAREAGTLLAAPLATEDAGTVARGRPRIHVVRRGETLAGIARHYGVPLAALKTANGLTSSRLTVGQKLALDADARSEARAPAKSGKRAAKAARPTRYTVRRGDTLYDIARRFDVEVDALLRWNRLSLGTRLKPGDTVTLYLARAD